MGLRATLAFAAVLFAIPAAADPCKAAKLILHQTAYNKIETEDEELALLDLVSEDLWNEAKKDASTGARFPSKAVSVEGHASYSSWDAARGNYLRNKGYERNAERSLSIVRKDLSPTELDAFVKLVFCGKANALLVSEVPHETAGQRVQLRVLWHDPGTRQPITVRSHLRGGKAVGARDGHLLPIDMTFSGGGQERIVTIERIGTQEIIGAVEIQGAVPENTAATAAPFRIPVAPQLETVVLTAVVDGAYCSETGNRLCRVSNSSGGFASINQAEPVKSSKGRITFLFDKPFALNPEVAAIALVNDRQQLRYFTYSISKEPADRLRGVIIEFRSITGGGIEIVPFLVTITGKVLKQ
jgi:hypothetical protein